MTIDDVKTLGNAIRAEVGKAITGQTDTVDLLLVALFANGHRSEERRVGKEC